MPSGKNPVIVKEFMGELLTDTIFGSGGSGIDKYRQSQIPFEYALNNENLLYLKKGGLCTRPGIKDYNNLSSLAGFAGEISQMWRIDNLNGIATEDLGTLNRFLVLTWDGVTGRMYDSAELFAGPRLVKVGMKYASVINAFGRMYISPWNEWAVPWAIDGAVSGSGYIWLYNGLYGATGARLTMCPEPVPGAMAVAAAAAGANPQCTPGLHLVSVVFETDSGFISTCPTSHIKAPLQVTTTAANAQINVTNIPVFPGAANWPAGMVVARHILMTKVVVNFNQNGFDSYEPFFVATLNDNVTTSVSINVPDSGIVDSAKYLINQSQSGVRSCVNMAVYKNRMVYLGQRSDSSTSDPNGFLNSVVYSPLNTPEQIGNVTSDGFRVLVGKDFSGRIMAGAELNGTFYIFKADSTFSQVANDDVDPAEWDQPSLIDSGKGAFPFGVANIGNNPSNLMDNSLLVGGNHGVSLFSGVYSQNSLVDAIWPRFSYQELRWMKVLVEPVRKIIFFRFGDHAIAPGNANGPLTFVYFADYYYGLNNLRWGKFVLPVLNSTQLYFVDAVLKEPTNTVPELNTLYSLLAFISKEGVSPYILLETNLLQDVDVFLAVKDISYKYETGYTPNEQGEINEFGPVKVRANSRTDGVSKTVTIKKGIIDRSTLDTVGSLVVTSDPMKYYSLPMNELNEHMRLEVSGNGAIIIQALELFMKQSALERPRP